MNLPNESPRPMMLFDSSIYKLGGERIPTLVVDTGPLGVIQWVNRPLEMLFGYNIYGELLGRSVELLVPESVRSVHVAHRAKLQESPYGQLMAGGKELKGRRKDGVEFPVMIWLVRAVLDGNHIVMAKVFDLSSRVL